jgi:hypothetical protein
MRYGYAKWLVEFTEKHGMGLRDGEAAAIEEAEFRVGGLALVRSVPAVQSDLSVEAEILPWEADVLGVVAHELLAVFDKGNGVDGE